MFQAGNISDEFAIGITYYLWLSWNGVNSLNHDIHETNTKLLVSSMKRNKFLNGANICMCVCVCCFVLTDQFCDGQMNFLLLLYLSCISVVHFKFSIFQFHSFNFVLSQYIWLQKRFCPHVLVFGSLIASMLFCIPWFLLLCILFQSTHSFNTCQFHQILWHIFSCALSPIHSPILGMSGLVVLIFFSCNASSLIS